MTVESIQQPYAHAARPTVIQPGGAFSLGLRELWGYRELLFIFVWRDLKVRYKQTFIGVAWAMLQPFATMLIFTLIFGRIAKLPSDGFPYPIFVFAGLLPWTYFATSLAQSSASVVSNVSLVTKVYFPRVLMPLGAVCVPVVDLVLGLFVLIGLMIYYGVAPAATAPLALVFLLLGLVTALGVGLWLSALNVRYRDIPYVIPFLTQIWLFLSPVVYPVTAVPEQWRWILTLNPMTAVIGGFRWSLLGGSVPSGVQIGVSVAVSFVLLVTGYWYFRRSQRTFADKI